MALSALNIRVRKPGFLGAEEAMLDLFRRDAASRPKERRRLRSEMLSTSNYWALGGRLYATSGLSAGGGIWSRNAGITHHIRAKSPSAPVQAALEIGVR